MEISKVFLPPDTTGNSQSPSNRTMQYETHGDVKLHVCNEEKWRFERIKRDLDNDRYKNLPPVNLAEYIKHTKKRKFRKGAKYGKGQYPE